MTVGGFSVIDAHHHVGTLEAQGFTSRPPGVSDEDYARRELDMRLSSMDGLGVDRAIVIPGHGYLRPNGIADTRRINDGIAAYRDGLPERFPAAVGITEPLYGAAGLDELARMKGELGLVGLSVHTRFQGVQTDSPLVMAMVERAAELGLVPFVHAVGEVPDEALWRVQVLARALPDTTFVVLDAFSSSEQARQVVPVALDTPNLLFDTSLCHAWILLAAFIARVGPERLVFGTDNYSLLAQPRHSQVLEELVTTTTITETAKRGILAGTLERVLGLTG